MLTYSTSQTDSGIVFLLSDPVMSPCLAAVFELPSKDGLNTTQTMSMTQIAQREDYAADLTSSHTT